MNVLLDTDIAIEILRGVNQDILSRWIDLIASESAILGSSIVAAEIWTGARPREHQAIDRFFRSLIFLPADCETGQLAGEFMRKYARSHGVETADALIAAASVQHKCALWTRNRKHYPMAQVTFF